MVIVSSAIAKSPVRPAARNRAGIQIASDMQTAKKATVPTATMG